MVKSFPVEEIMMDKDIDEILEIIWTCREEGKMELSSIKEEIRISQGKLDLGTIPIKDMLEKMVDMDLISIRDNRVYLEGEGERRAVEIIRRHRIAETLLKEVFEIEENHMESSACKFEHVLSSKVTDSVCTFLGHPRYCPHGKPIPKAECCNKFQSDLKPLVMRLCDFPIGEDAYIVFITPKHHRHLDRLSSLGLVPGSKLKLHQRQPSYIISIGEMDMAIDDDIAKEIYVKKL